MNSPNLDKCSSLQTLEVPCTICSNICTSDWRKDWELTECVLWETIKNTRHFQALCQHHGIVVEEWKEQNFGSLNTTWGKTCDFAAKLEFWSTHHELFGLDRSMAFEACYSVASDDSGYDSTSPLPAPINLPETLDVPFPCTGLCGTDNYTRCPYCLIFRMKVSEPTDIFSLKTRMLTRKSIWEATSNLCNNKFAHAVSAMIWSFLVPSELLFIPVMSFYGDTFDYFLSQIQRRIDTRTMQRVHQSLREAPLKKPSRAERYELNFKDECGDWEREDDFWRRFRSEEGYLLTLKYCRDHITEYEDHFQTPMYIPTSYVPEFDTNILNFYGRVRTRGKKSRSGEINEEKKKRRKKSRERSIQRSNERLRRRKHIVCSDFLDA